MNSGPGSTVKIIDDLAAADISRQRKYQLRKLRQGRCIICGRKAYRQTQFCLRHNLKRGIRKPGRNKQYAAPGIGNI